VRDLSCSSDGVQRRSPDCLRPARLAGWELNRYRG